MIKISIQPLSLEINGHLIVTAPKLHEITELFGNPIGRTFEIENGGAAWRKFVTFDEIGVWLLYDYEVDKILDVHFVMAKPIAHMEPKCIFNDILFINDTRILPGMREKHLPVQGNFYFVKRGGWESSSDSLFVNFQISQRTKRLRAVSVTFLKRPLFSNENQSKVS